MAGGTHVEIRGLPALMRKLNDPTWVSGPVEQFLDRWRFATQRKTVSNFKRGKQGGWIDTGLTRRSTASERDQGKYPSWAKVGSNQDTFRWGEYGTGRLSEDPKSSRRRHWPPASALEPWARKHGFPEGGGFLVARAIGRRGGIAPRRYLRDAAKSTERQIPKYLGMMAKDIERAAERSR